MRSMAILNLQMASIVVQTQRKISVLILMEDDEHQSKIRYFCQAKVQTASQRPTNQKVKSSLC